LKTISFTKRLEIGYYFTCDSC